MSNNFQRNTGLDVIRSIALFSVVAVHFFLNTGFYDEIIVGPLMQFLVYVRSGLMISVPLFLLLSGYLLCHKTATRDYYFRIVRIIFVYLAASAVHSYYRVFIIEDLPISFAFWGVFSYTTLTYGWYIHMYLGLFLLIPFLNILYSALDTKKQKQGLILTLLLLTAAPGMFNIFRFEELQWWLQPSSNLGFRQLVPQWWMNLYPLTYYFIGCYLREYPLRMKRSSHIVLILSFIFISGSWNIYRSHHGTFIHGVWQERFSVFNAVLSVLIFSFFESMNYDKMARPLKKVFACMSDWSLGAYLMSEMYDDIIYRKLNAAVPLFQDRVKYCFLAVPIILIASLLTSFLFELLYKHIVAKLVDKLRQTTHV